MIAFDNGHSDAWDALMQSYQEYRARLFHWAKTADAAKARDLQLALDSSPTGEEHPLHRLLLVTDFLRSTDMWDTQAVLLARETLTELALTAQDEVAAYAREALKKIKRCPERMESAGQIFRAAAAEAAKTDPDDMLFHNGCMLLYHLDCKKQFKQFTAEYQKFIFLASGLDEADLRAMGEEMGPVC